MINFHILQQSYEHKTVLIQLCNSFDNRELPTNYIITSCHFILFNFLVPYEIVLISIFILL